MTHWQIVVRLLRFMKPLNGIMALSTFSRAVKLLMQTAIIAYAVAGVSMYVAAPETETLWTIGKMLVFYAFVLGLFNSAFDQRFGAGLFVIGWDGVGFARGGAGHWIPAFAHRKIFQFVRGCASAGQFLFRFLPVGCRGLVVRPPVNQGQFMGPL